MKKFSDVRKQLEENKLKSATFAFGRFNPPTIGHAKLFDMVSKVGATHDNHFVFASHSQDDKKNPLEPNFKRKILAKAFPQNNVQSSGRGMPTVLYVASHLYDKGFRKITLVAGSDRVNEFTTLLNKYNGVKSRHGFYDFGEIKVVSSGERDADSEGASGASGTNMRMYAAKDDFDSFRKYSPVNLSDKEVKQVFDKVRAVVPRLNAETLAPTLGVREEYLLGDIFNVGDTVADIHEEREYIIVERGPNFVRCSDDEGNVVSKWLTDLEERKVAQDPDIDDKKGTQPKKYYAGLGKSTKDRRDAQFKKQAKMDDDNPNAYKPAPGDATAKTKPSKHTNKFKQMFGEDVLDEDVKKSLKDKAEKSGMPYGILKKVFDRGVAAWRTGHRPGTTPTQWGLARVNSFATKSKGTWGKADADLAAKVRGESVELDEAPRWLIDLLGDKLHSNQYKKALEILTQVIDRKAKEAGGVKKIKHGYSYYAAQISRQFKNVDARVLADVYAKSLNEEGGAGEWGTDKLLKKYKKETPFQEQKINAEYEVEGFYKREYSEEEVEDDSEGASKVAQSLEIDFEDADEEDDFNDMFDALDWDDVHIAYDDDELDAEEDDIEHDLEDDEGVVTDDGEVTEVLSPAQRQKRRVLMRRIGKRLARLRKIRLKKRSSQEVLMKRARKVAVKMIKRKLIKNRPFDELSMADRARLEKYVAKKGNLIARLSKRLLPKMRKIENARIKGKKVESFQGFINSPITEEAEYQGRKVKLNDPFRLPSGSTKKFGVYVKNDKGNVVKVTFGDPDMDIQRDNPERLNAFRARHGCDVDPGPKWKAKYWSCKMWEKGKKVSDLD